MFVQFVCFSKFRQSRGVGEMQVIVTHWVRCKSVPEHLGISALKQHADRSEGLGSPLPVELPGVEREGIPELANIVDGNLVEAFQSLGYHWDERETLLVTIVRHPRVFRW